MLECIAVHTDSLQIVEVRERDFQISLYTKAFLHTRWRRVQEHYECTLGSWECKRVVERLE